MTAVIIALIAAIPPTLLALATLIQARASARKTEAIYVMSVAAEKHHRNGA